MYLLKTVESLGDIERVQEWPIKNINFSSLYGVPMSSTDTLLYQVDIGFLKIDSNLVILCTAQNRLNSTRSSPI